MTTLVALVSKDALVMGTDSLATVTRQLVDPRDLLMYFDRDNDFKIKVDDHGKPLLDSLPTLMDQAQSVPYNQLNNVSKLFDLSPLPMGVMFSGITSIGDRTIGKMISAFKERELASVPGTEQSNYTVRSVCDRLREFLRQYYASIYPQAYMQPELELIIGGYGKLGHLPSLYRIDVQEDTIDEVFSSESPFGVAFGGQKDWIQRIVFGTDVENQVRLAERTHALLLDYHRLISDAVANAGIAFEVPGADSWGDELGLLKQAVLRGNQT